MADKPILFSGPMVRALLAGTKTQTRRILKPQPEMQGNGLYHVSGAGGGVVNVAESDIGSTAVDYLRISAGDRLYVRETCSALEAFDGTDIVRFDADAATIQIENTPEAAARWAEMHHYGQKRGASVPSIHMPRWASRLTLTVTDVRVERLQDCSEANALAEGMTQATADAIMGPEELALYASTHILCPEARGRILYETVWETINGPGSWEASPWVAAYSFTVEHGNIDTLAKAS